MNDYFKAYGNLYTQAERKELIAQSMKVFRERAKKSQKEIADAIGINAQTYAAYERGRNETPAEILVRLSLYYDVPLDIIMQRDNMNKNAFNVQQQFNTFEKELQSVSNKLSAGDEETQQQFQKLADGIEKLTAVIKEIKQITDNIDEDEEENS